MVTSNLAGSGKRARTTSRRRRLRLRKKEQPREKRAWTTCRLFLRPTASAIANRVRGHGREEDRGHDRLSKSTKTTTTIRSRTCVPTTIRSDVSLLRRVRLSCRAPPLTRQPSRCATRVSTAAEATLVIGVAASRVAKRSERSVPG